MSTKMNNTGTTGYIWLSGSRRTIRRTVWKTNDKYYVKYGGDYIEVKCNNGGSKYNTVEAY